jgi:hypothetical protein
MVAHINDAPVILYYTPILGAFPVFFAAVVLEIFDTAFLTPYIRGCPKEQPQKYDKRNSSNVPARGHTHVLLLKAYHNRVESSRILLAWPGTFSTPSCQTALFENEKGKGF